MKRVLLTFVAFATTLASVAQVAFTINPPSTNAGSYSVTYADDFTTWGVPDLNIPANFVLDTVAIVQGTDSLGCNAVTNGPDILGKVAMIWRGDCQFGTKALNAQNAGAIAVIIVNNAGEPAGMAGGNDGLSVTIPVVMISTQTGQLIYDEIQAGNDVEVFIGNKFGFFANDMVVAQKDVLRPQYFAKPIALATNDSEFSVNVGAWVFNFGTDTQTGVTLTATIENGAGQSLYNVTSSPGVSVPSGDSVFILLDPFSQTTYTEDYFTMEYSVNADLTDEFISDNSLNTDFMLTAGELSYARLDATTAEPVEVLHTLPANFDSRFWNCTHFVDANASRMIATGITFSAETFDPATLTGEVVGVEMYTWDDAITDINDPGFLLDNINPVGGGLYIYAGELQRELVTADFDAPVALVDNQNYLFCLTSEGPEVRLGFDNKMDYNQNIYNVDNSIAPGHITTLIRNGDNLFGLGFGSDLASSMVVNLVEPTGVEESNKVELGAAFPNPTVNMITIPVSNVTGSAQLNIVDVTGRVVLSETVNVSGNQLTVDVSKLTSGQYVFDLQLENGKQSTFNVVVSK